jgi:hypothetical protein
MRSRDIISEATRADFSADSRPTRGWSQEACMIGLCDLCLFGAARSAHLRVARAAAQPRHYMCRYYPFR